MSIWQAMMGFDGRISRKPYWLANIVLLVAWCASFAVLLHWRSGGRWLDERYGKTPEAATAEGIVALICIAIFLYPSLAVLTRRLHDLDRTGWWCVPAVAVPGLYSLAQLAGLTGPPDAENALGSIFFWSSLVLGVAYVAIPGFLGGTAGPNGYGPDPLARVPA